MTREEIKELKGLAASMGLYDDKNPCKRAVVLGKAIEALQQAPCTDAISRQAVLNLAKFDGRDGLGSIIHAFDVEQLPPVKPQYTDAEIQKMQDLEFSEIQKAYEIGKEEGSSEKPNKWIPVSERLPKPYTWVYATCKSLVDDRENWVIDTCYVPLPKEYNSKYSDWGNIPMLNWGQAEVIAWMEWIIPEPYNASPTGAEGSDKE